LRRKGLAVVRRGLALLNVVDARIKGLGRLQFTDPEAALLRTTVSRATLAAAVQQVLD
jgi:hypothetical protein